VSITRWNSDPDWSRVQSTTRKAGDLRWPHTYLVFDIADLALRVPTWRSRALDSQAVVLADRYLLTAAARAVVRGISEEEIAAMCAFAPAPDLQILLDVPTEVALERKMPLNDRQWQNGLGVSPSPDRLDERAYRAYQDSFRRSLLDLARRTGAVVLDARRPIAELLAEALDAVALVHATAPSSI
jgi:thymidylate kinase